MVCLHATDPATVYLSVLARCARLGLDDVARELYADRSLLRMLAMRRTLFVVPTALVPVLHHAAALDVAARMRKRLLKELGSAPTDPPLPADVAAWLVDVETSVEAVVERLGSATGAQIGAAEPRLRTAILPTTDKKYDVRRTVTTSVLALMGAEGRLVRHEPRGSWTSRQHTWQAASTWWPDGIPDLPVAQARARLVGEYLQRFGPATETDVAWWTGWPLGVTREALGDLSLEQTSEGWVLADDTEPVEPPAATAALLPALDATPMGWKQRDWFLPEDSRPLYDGAGNVGPTLWWRGEVVGGWGVGPDGTVRWRFLVDRGAEALRAVAAAAVELTERLAGTVLAPSFRTPLERELSA